MKVVHDSSQGGPIWAPERVKTIFFFFFFFFFFGGGGGGDSM